MNKPTHLIATSGLVILISNILAISRSQFRSEEGVAAKLAALDTVPANPVYVLTADHGIQIVDLSDAYNRASLIPGNEYVTHEYCLRLLVEEWMTTK